MTSAAQSHFPARFTGLISDYCYSLQKYTAQHGYTTSKTKT
jgi:hypothetical protein